MSSKYSGIIIPVPLGEHMRTVDDKEIIDSVSWFEARKQYYRWTVNDATIAYYNALISEWKRRYGKKQIPRKPYTKADLQGFYEEFMGVNDEIEI